MHVGSAERPRTYHFHPVAECEMCGADPNRFLLLGMRLNTSQGLRPRTASGIATAVKRCANCGLIFADPQPRPEQLSEHYGKAEDYWSDGYFDSDPGYFREQIEDAKRLLAGRANPTALDIGAGIGKAMQALEGAGFDTYGFEPGSDYRDVALKRGISPQRLRHATVEDVQYGSQTFDFITFGAVLEHLFTPAASLKKAMSWLKPGGIIHAEVPNANWLIADLINRYMRLRGTTYVTHLSPMHPPFHMFEFTHRSFELLGEQIGFEVVMSRIDVCEVMQVPRPLQPLFKRIMVATGKGMQLTVFLRKH